MTKTRLLTPRYQAALWISSLIAFVLLGMQYLEWLTDYEVAPGIKLILGPLFLGSVLALAVTAHRAPHYLAFREYELPPDGEHCVYLFTRPDGLTKIGYSSQVSRRKSSIQSAIGVEVYPLGFARLGSEAEARWVEQELHKYFAGDRQHGEWFRLSVHDIYDVFREFREFDMPVGLAVTM